jgi:hypothetical protein
VRLNLKNSQENALALAEVMVEKSPQQMKSRAEELSQRARKSFFDCMAVYSGATGGEDQFDDKVDDSD